MHGSQHAAGMAAAVALTSPWADMPLCDNQICACFALIVVACVAAMTVAQDERRRLNLIVVRRAGADCCHGPQSLAQALCPRRPALQARRRL